MTLGALKVKEVESISIPKSYFFYVSKQIEFNIWGTKQAFFQ